MKQITFATQQPVVAAGARPCVAVGLAPAPRPFATVPAFATAGMPCTGAPFLSMVMEMAADMGNQYAVTVSASTTDWSAAHLTKRPSRHLGDLPT